MAVFYCPILSGGGWRKVSCQLFRQVMRLLCWARQRTHDLLDSVLSDGQHTLVKLAHSHHHVAPEGTRAEADLPRFDKTIKIGRSFP